MASDLNNEATRTGMLYGAHDEIDEEEHSFKHFIQKSTDIISNKMQDKGTKQINKEGGAIGSIFEHTFRPKQSRNSNVGQLQL